MSGRGRAWLLLAAAICCAACGERTFDNPVDPGAEGGGAVARSFPAPTGDPAGATWSESYLWIADATRPRLFRLDPRDGGVDRQLWLDVPRLAGLALDQGRFVALDPGAGTLYWFDPLDGHLLGSRPAPGVQPWGVAVEGAEAWFSDPARGEIIHVTWPELEPLGVFPAPGPAPLGIVERDGVLFVADEQLQRILMVAADSGALLDEFPCAGAAPRGLAFGDGLLWSPDAEGTVIAYRTGVGAGHGARGLRGLPAPALPRRLGPAGARVPGSRGHQ